MICISLSRIQPRASQTPEQNSATTLSSRTLRRRRSTLAAFGMRSMSTAQVSTAFPNRCSHSEKLNVRCFAFFAGVIDLYVLRARDLALGTFATAPLTLDWIYVRFPAGYSTAHRPFPQWAAPNLPYLYEIALALQIVSSPLLVSTYIAEIFHLALSAASSCAQFSCVSV